MTKYIHTVVFIICALHFSKGTHFRGGTIGWKPTGNGNEVEFKFNLGWKYGDGPGCNESIIGNYVNNLNNNTVWKCTSGCGPGTVILSSSGYICTAASKAEDWEQGEYTFKYSFSGVGPFTVAYSSSAWIASVSNGTGEWSIVTTVNLRKRSDLHVPNSSPITAVKPLYTVKYGCTQTVTIPFLDLEGDNVKCRWAVGDECKSVCNRIATTAVLHDNCTLTFTASTSKGGLFAAAIMMEDRPAKTITLDGQVYTPNDVLSKVPLQFLISTPDIPSRSCSDRPVFVQPTPEDSVIFVVLPGQSLLTGFYASSTGTSIISFLLIGPPGIRQSAVRQVTLRPGVYSIDVIWTPSASDKGPKSLCVEATDAFRISSEMRCITIAAWDMNPCDSNPCQNKATCNRVGYTQDFICTCLPGYTGLHCETDINECTSSPCQNGATCFDLINEFFCGCQDGYTGLTCQTDINECETRTCQNGGTCLDTVGAAVCVCVPGFTGEICQTGIDYCKSLPCQNNGKCAYNETTGYKCECTDGWYGVHCAIRHENESFANSTHMSTDYMHYSLCDCFFGHGRQQLCYIYDFKESVEFGALGAALGLLTAIVLYALAEIFLHTHNVPSTLDESLHTGDVNEDKNKTDAIETTEDSEKEVIKNEKPVGHRHRSCWACDVKHGRMPPPPWLQN